MAFARLPDGAVTSARSPIERARAEVARQLKCIRCGAPGLRDEAAAWRCPACSSVFPVRAGVARFVAGQAYSESFGFEWNYFARTQLDSTRGEARSRETFIQKTGWSLDALRDKRVLDAGCGMGRFAEVCAEAGAEVYAVDLSTAVEAAYRNLGHRGNVHFFQADIMNLPFADETFDFIYSIGVLHHTPDTRAAFLRLVPLLKPGGTIAIWVYGKRLRLLVGGEILRAATRWLPRKWLLHASKIAIPLYHIHRLPVVGTATSILLPTSKDPDPEWRWLDTFDWYSPRYQWKHTCEEVEAWFREAGLVQMRRGAFPVTVSGIRPSPAGRVV